MRQVPVLVHDDEDNSIPRRLASHQRVDLRRDFDARMNELAKMCKLYIMCLDVSDMLA